MQPVNLGHRHSHSGFLGLLTREGLSKMLTPEYSWNCAFLEEDLPSDRTSWVQSAPSSPEAGKVAAKLFRAECAKILHGKAPDIGRIQHNNQLQEEAGLYIRVMHIPKRPASAKNCCRQEQAKVENHLRRTGNGVVFIGTHDTGLRRNFPPGFTRGTHHSVWPIVVSTPGVINIRHDATRP